MLTGAVVCQGLYALRVPVDGHKTVEKALTEWSPKKDLNGILLNKRTGRIKFRDIVKTSVVLDFVLWGVRHGETEANKNKMMFQGNVDEEIDQLTDKGKEQAREAAEVLFAQLKDKIASGEEIVVITSDLKRAKDTADAFISLVKERTGITIKPEVDKYANEISFGIWDNKTPEQLSSRDRYFIIQYRKNNATTRPKNGESFLDLLIRRKKLLETINKSHKGKIVVLFSHGVGLTADRVLLGDTALIDKTGQIDWKRKNMLPNGAARLLYTPSTETFNPENIPSAVGNRNQI